MNRRTTLVELGVIELVDRLLVLEVENEALKRQLAGAFCGELHDGFSCQLARGHDCEHVWISADFGVMIRWPKASEKPAPVPVSRQHG